MLVLRLSTCLLLAGVAMPLVAQDIHQAAREGNLERVEELLTANPSLLNEMHSDGLLPIHAAIRKAHVQVAELILSRTGDVNVKCRRGRTPLLHAAYRGNREIAKMLLARDARVDLPDGRGKTPALYAAEYGHAEILELLIEAGADINAASVDGWTPLSIAIGNDNRPEVEVLLERGVEAKGKLRSELINYAARQGDLALVGELLKGEEGLLDGAIPSERLAFNAATGGLDKLLATLIARGVAPDATDAYGETLLHRACSSGHELTVRFLVKRGADVERPRPDGTTPVQLAVRAGHEEIAEYLRQQGAPGAQGSFPELTGSYLSQTSPGNRAAVFAPGLVSTDEFELCSAILGKGTGFVFRRYGASQGSRLLITQLRDGRWTAPTPATFQGGHKPFNFTGGGDGRTFLFTSTLDASTEHGDANIWRVQRTASGWSDPEELPAPVNTEWSDNYPSATRDGTLYFMSNRPGGYGAVDVYRAQVQDGAYLKVENLGPSVNTDDSEFDPVVAPDESYVIYCSGKYGRHDGHDLFISFRKQDGSWAKAVNLAAELGIETPQNRPSLSPDGRFLFFVTDGGPSNRADIYWVETEAFEHLRPS